MRYSVKRVSREPKLIQRGKYVTFLRMSGQPRNVDLFISADGRTPFEAWITMIGDCCSLGQIFASVSELSRGNFQSSMSIGCGVYVQEVRDAETSCIYFALTGNDALLILGGGKKESSKADRTRALKMWEEFRENAH